MKTRFKLLLCLVLVFALSASLFSISASAENNYNISTGETCHGMIVYEFDDIIVDSGFSQAIGSFCNGLNYTYDGRYFLVDGTPSAAGTFWLNGTAKLIDGSTQSYSFTINVDNDDPYRPVDPPVTEPAPYVTKDPTSETMLEGGSAMFIARADNASKIEWFLMDPRGNHNAPGYIASLYSGFSFTGRNSEVFEIYNVPLDLNGWYAVCIFSNDGGSIECTPAKITVEEFNAESPSITSHPQSASKTKGESTLLTVLANNKSGGGTLKYQWYMSNTGASNLNPISGANASSYTPPQTVGTIYYTVAVWTSYNDRDSAKVYSNPAAVTYTEVRPSATPAPSPTVPPTVLPSATAAPTPQGVEADKDRGGSGLLLGLIVALILSAAMATVILLILRKNAKQNAEAAPDIISQIKVSDIRPGAPVETTPAADKRQHTTVWQCSCGALNDSQFCTQCGKPRFVKKSCANCGWTPDSPNQIPRFCPECGSPFDQDN